MAQGTVGLDERESMDMSKRKQDDGGADGESEDDAVGAPRRGMKTLTKVVLVAVGWVLLTLFLVGQFSDDPADENARARLDTTSENVDLDGDGVVDEVVEEEATDVNGDGIIEIGEGIDEGEATASGEDGDDGGTEGAAGVGAGESSGASAGSGSGSYQATPTETRSPNAVPGAPPPGGTSATTTGADSSGSSSTTSTTQGPTTTAGGGGATSSSTSTTTTTTTTAGQPPPSNSAIILIVKARNEAYEYPSGYSANFSFATGSKVRIDNIEAGNGTKHTFTVVDGWDSGDVRRDDTPKESPPFTPGTYTYACKYFPSTMRGTITVS